MSDLLGARSLCSCSSPSFEKRTLYCDEYEDSVMTCSLCLQELSIDKWDQRKGNQKSSNTQSRTLKVDIDQAQQATVPIYVRRQSSMEGYVTEKILPEVKSRPSSVLSPDLWKHQPHYLQQEDGDFDIKAMNDCLSYIPCNECRQPKTPVYGFRNESPLAWNCSSCNDCTGVDDTCTTHDAFELADLHASSLKNATLQVDPCKGCGENTNPELKVGGELVMECMCCDHREPLQCLDGDIVGPTEEFGDGDNVKYGLKCECGNTNPDEFRNEWKNKKTYKVTCLACGRMSEYDESNLTTYQQSSAYTKVSDLSQLNPGDHIKFDRDLAFWHHAIVEGVDLRTEQIDVIHYNGRVKGPWGEVMRETVSVNLKKVSLHRVDCEDCLPWDTVLIRALTRFKEHKYRLLFNNCEHFTQWCKIGISKSDQVGSLKKNTIHTGLKAAAFAAKDGSKQIFNVLKSAGKTGMRTVARSFTKIDAAMVGFSVSFEVVRTGLSVFKYHKQKKAGEISREEFIRCTVKRVFQGAGGAAGTVAGSIIGNLIIPIPVLGCFIGATVGAFIGNFLGRVIGRQALKLRRPLERLGSRVKDFLTRKK